MATLEGMIRNVTFYNEENAYAVIKVEVESTDACRGLLSALEEGVVTVTGYFPKPLKGERYRFTGDFVHHERFGEQFNATGAEKLEEVGISGLVDYLSSDLFPGVGEKTAERIVETLGNEAIKKALNDPDALDAVPRLSAKQKQSLLSGLKTHKASEQTLIKLYEYGISGKLAMRIFNTYQEATLRKLEENPYRMIRDVDGIGFERADAIARKLGLDETDARRINALIEHTFAQLALHQGHTVLERDAFMAELVERLTQDIDNLSQDLIDTELDRLLKAGTFVDVDGRLTLGSIVGAEKRIVEKVEALKRGENTIDETKARTLISALEGREGVRYTKKQKDGVIQSLKHRITIITGGPGTGKTTVIKAVIDAYSRYHNIRNRDADIRLIAPTGRAAKRMEEATRHAAQTIHRLLGYSYDGRFEHDRLNPVEGKLFIVDEASMIDLFLAAQLFESLPDYAHVVLVGDDAQLPSVGPGQVFKDLLDSRAVPSIELDVIHRQEKQSKIIELASHIREGKLPKGLHKVHSDRYVFKETEANAQSRLKRIIDYMIEQGHDFYTDIQVLIPMYRGPSGIDEINRFLQTTYNGGAKRSLTYGDTTFKEGDKVLQLVNQVEDNVMNGDQGSVLAVDEEEGALTVRFDGHDVTYKTKDLANLTLAYAISIHKSQGSEYKVVVLPLFSRHAVMLKRKLIYTAITRAKSTLVVYGDVDRLAYAVERLEEARHTLLKSRLNAITPKKRIDEPLPLKRETKAEPTADATPFQDDDIPFDENGEDLGGKTPHDF